MNIQHLYYYYYCIIAITLYGALVVTLAILLRLINCRFIIIITVTIIRILTNWECYK